MIDHSNKPLVLRNSLFFICVIMDCKLDIILWDQVVQIINTC